MAREKTFHYKKSLVLTTIFLLVSLQFIIFYTISLVFLDNTDGSYFSEDEIN